MSNLPTQICKRCLYSTLHPLGLVLDEEGICSGCRVHEEKDRLNWAERWERLEQLVKPYRSRDSRNYDCIVPVTGAGDSFFILHLVKERLRLKPLLVTYNRYYNTPLGIRNLAQLRRRFDCDILIQSVNPRCVKKIIRTTLRQLGSFHWPVLAGQSVFPVQTAVTHGVPLILWGAHQGLEQVGMFSHLHEVEMTRRYRKDHDLMGFEADDLLSHFDMLTEEDIWQYRYPAEASLEKVGVRGIYLGNYVRWDPLAQHLQMVKEAGYHSAVMPRTFDVYDHVDDWHYMGMHDWIKHKKHGYGRVLDQACREIRHQRINRDQAVALVRKFQAQSPKTDDLLLDWLQLDKEALEFVIDQNWRQELDYSLMPTHEDSDAQAFLDEFTPNDKLERLFNRSHVVIGKGYPD
jgi:N-acetyl sugar amidotransferase